MPCTDALSRWPFLPRSILLATALSFGMSFGASKTTPADAVEPTPKPITLTDVTRATGIDFVHTDGSSGQRYIVETVSAGLATFDYDNDGLTDILFLSSGLLKGANPTNPGTCALFKNLGNMKFRNVTKSAGLDIPCYALGVAIADYDNDGNEDIYINTFGRNLLFHNNGNGTFSDVTAKAGVQDDPHVGAGTCFFDIDGDGWLDLFVGHYVDFTYEKHHTVRFNGYPAYVGPLNYSTTASKLYRNRGDGTFEDVTDSSGIGAHKGAAMGVVSTDVDGDGDMDLFVANDECGNFLYLNDGHGHFKESGLASGVAYDFDGQPHGSMGVECADFDNDGLLDFFVTSFQRESPILYLNRGKAMFEDVTTRSGPIAGNRSLVTWGCGLVDLDNDGNRDIFIAAGHLHDNVEQFDTSTSYFQRNRLLRNIGKGKFVDVTTRSGDGLNANYSSRGAVFDDLDNDGAIDVVILNARREPTILRNESKTGNHWLQLRLHGAKLNRDAIGARVTVTAGGTRFVDEVHSGRSYQSHFGSRLQFGLGTMDHVDQVEIKWPEGAVEVLKNLPVDRFFNITQGTGKAEPTTASH